MWGVRGEGELLPQSVPGTHLERERWQTERSHSSQQMLEEQGERQTETWAQFGTVVGLGMTLVLQSAEMVAH